MDVVSERYEPALAAARVALEEHAAVRQIVADDCEPELFHLWLLRYSAHGVRMTEQVEKWISRAGQKCLNIGFPDLGRALEAHARAESGHEQLMISDARYLADRWNENSASPIDAERLIKNPPLPSTLSYIKLHEETIDGGRPFGQVAIEYEIERLSTSLGPAIVAQCRRCIGDGTGYSFLTDHVELDQGHTAFNRRQLKILLDRREEDLLFLVQTGRRALAAYLEFMAECLSLAKSDLAREVEYRAGAVRPTLQAVTSS